MPPERVRRTGRSLSASFIVGNSLNRRNGRMACSARPVAPAVPMSTRVVKVAVPSAVVSLMKMGCGVLVRRCLPDRASVGVEDAPPMAYG